MSALDIIIILVAGAGLVIGFTRGIISQIGQIAGLVGGIAAARIFGSTLASAFSKTPDTLETVCGYIAAFVVAYFLVWAVFRILRKTVHGIKLGIVDRVAGALFKALQWLVVLSLALNLYLAIRFDDSDIRSPQKPWRSAVIDLAPALLGYLSHFHNSHAPDGVNNNKTTDEDKQS